MTKRMTRKDWKMVVALVMLFVVRAGETVVKVEYRGASRVVVTKEN